MKVLRLAAIFSILLALIPTIMPAADLPVLPKDKNISTGVLDNGISYYIVSNKTEVGRMDISLVQKAGFSSEDSLSRGSSVVHSIGALATLPRFRTPSPVRYLVSNAVWPGRDGYVTVGDDATVFRFSNIAVTPGMEAVDSTLLMVFEIINAAPGAVSGRYPLGSQAIIISGDITSSVAFGKLDMLSMLINRKDSPVAQEQYLWRETSRPVVRYYPAPAEGVTRIVFDWRCPRTPQDQMETIQPLVSGMFYKELEALSMKRLKRAFREAGIATSALGTQYIGSDVQSGDEHFIVNVTVAEKDQKKALDVFIETMAAIDRRGSVPVEYKDISCKVRTDIALAGSINAETNQAYTDKCISSFMYGTSLATEVSKSTFLTGRKLDPAVSLRIFNSFADAILGGRKNLVVKCYADSLSLPEPAVLGALASWNDGDIDTQIPFTGQSDTLNLAYEPSKKVKLKETNKDPMADGTIFTFSNGMRVIYKKTDSKGVIRYSWTQKGGWAFIHGLVPGEEAYVSDMLLLSNIGSMPGRRFADMLAANGITLIPRVSPNDFCLHGAAPSDKLTLLLKAIAALAHKRTPDPDSFELYRKSNAIERAAEGNSDLHYKYLVDSLLCPKGLYSPIKRNKNLSAGLPAKAEEFFQRQFSNMRGGVLIVTGDISEAALQKALLSWLGRFPAGSASAPRFRSEANFISRKVKRKVLDAEKEPRIEMALTTPVDYNTDNFILSGIVSDAVRRAVCGTVVPLGWTCTTRWDLNMFPEERLTVRLSLRKQHSNGLPASISQADSVQYVVARVREALSSLSESGVSRQAFKLGKSYMTSDIKTWTSYPDYLHRLFELRYNYGKDFLAGLSEKSEKLKASDANALLRDLLVGGGSSEVLVPQLVTGDVITEPVLPEPELPYIERGQEWVDETGLLELFREVWQITEQ